MLDVSVRRPIAPAEVEAIRRLAVAAEAADGHPSLGDSVWRDLAAPTPTSAVGIATIGGEPAGAVHVAPPENDDGDPITMSLVIDPAHRDTAVERALLDDALRDPALGGHRILLWVFGADDASDRLAAAVRFAPERELHQMRVPLPLAARVAWPEGIEIRAFRPGVDEDAWLAVNNRAFADDPDQHGWTIETLHRREADPWFDPAGFLLAWRGNGLAGFCWTKLHPASPPAEPNALGEIYVIGVDPGNQGTGLGRALVIGGLASLHGRGATTGMLFVDAANTAAVALYGTLGFTVSRTDRAYARTAP
jgi:mycothiol synthase